MWERYRTPYSLISGGFGSGLWKSTDAGATWTEIKGGGYPEGLKGRIGIAVAPSNPQIVYALTEAASIAPGRMQFQRNPAGEWSLPLGGRRQDLGSHEHHRHAPVLLLAGARRSKEPGSRLLLVHGAPGIERRRQDEHERRAEVHVDDHGLWIDPNDPERWVIANDGGIAITFDRGGNFCIRRNLPIGQFYEISYDYAVPYNICSGAQDNGAWCGPSKRRTTPSTNTYWCTISGGDGFYTAQDPTDPDMV